MSELFRVYYEQPAGPVAFARAVQSRFQVLQQGCSMTPTVTFQVLDGIDKGRVFRDLALTPFVTIGREEGNQLRLNDERVSRFHAKVQADNCDIILTDLESTNGTRVNGHSVDIRRLRAGDRISLGRSVLLYGSNEEIAARMASLAASRPPEPSSGTAYSSNGPATMQAPTFATHFEEDLEFDLNIQTPITEADGQLFIAGRPLPPLPQRLTPGQAARLAEILDFLHRSLTLATENVRANEDGTECLLPYADWQRTLAVQMLLARYLRAVAEPDALRENE